MTATITARLCLATLVACISCWSVVAIGQEARTVIGPRNQNLADGANALLSGNAQEGVRLTLLGLEHAASARDRKVGMSNLCAGYVLLDELDSALEYCNRVLEIDDKHWKAYSNRALVYVRMRRYDEAEADLQRGEAIAPNSRTLRAVRAMLLDAVEPVAPSVVIDDRRQPARDKDND